MAARVSNMGHVTSIGPNQSTPFEFGFMSVIFLQQHYFSFPKVEIFICED